MKKLNTYLAAGIAAFGLSAICFSANAAGPDEAAAPDCPYAQSKDVKKGERPGPSPEEMKQERIKHRAALHDKLNLNAEQEKAWENYIAVADKNQDIYKRPSREAFEKMTAPERMQTVIDGMKAHEKAWTEQLAYLKVFYNKLTPEQQKIFNNETKRPPMPPRRGPGPRGPRPAPRN